MKTSRQFCRLVPLVIAVLVACVAPVAAVAENVSFQPDATPTPLEQFKNFISSPPVIRNLVFQQ